MHLSKALGDARAIGPAVGVLMATRRIPAPEASIVLEEIAARCDVPLRAAAELVMLTR